MKSQPSVAFLLHDVARLMRARFDAHARILGTTRQQWRLLMNLAREGEGRTQAELADALDVERITLCRMIDRLAESGLVERRPDPSDRRVWRIHLLEPAHAIIDELAGIGSRLEEETLGVLDSDERTALVGQLERLRDGLKGRADERTAA
jgi:DNA-binding MarR family transcriptional regulator